MIPEVDKIYIVIETILNEKKITDKKVEYIKVKKIQI